MATTSGTAPRDALEALENAGMRFALLHGEREAAAGQTHGDLDMVVEMDARRLVAATGRSFHAFGLRPVLVWRYDVSSTATVFLAANDASAGVQMDLLCCPQS